MHFFATSHNSAIATVLGVPLRQLLILTGSDFVKMVSVERVQEYTCIEPEADLEVSECKPPDKWPEHGAITGENVRFSYHSSLPSVLKDISFTIKSKEKVCTCTLILQLRTITLFQRELLDSYYCYCYRHRHRYHS